MRCGLDLVSLYSPIYFRLTPKRVSQGYVRTGHTKIKGVIQYTPFYPLYQWYTLQKQLPCQGELF